ncbi:zinc finger protein OZF-like isoform X1 [Acipenser ruthenus]|uniref:zinc finger protein OZF-like isoform X1 n=1 Tax=Acipenser ruthenus TaxID=7906 RepID=UPI002741AC76|nr:zinc finger protein OZF-like isoform X1 [Acipenser ruthenus]
MDQPHSKEVSEMEAARISPELPVRWVVSADGTVEIKEEVTELGCDQANERSLQEETPPSSITERAAGDEGSHWNSTGDSSTACNIDEGDHDSTPSLHCKNSSSGKPQRKKRRETIPQEENADKLRVQIPSVQDRQPLTLESTETAHSVCVNHSETQGNLKTLPCSTEDGNSSWQLGSPKTHKENYTGWTPFPCADCGKRFSCLSNLKRHQLSHTGEKPHHCTECEKRFSRLEHLTHHQRIHTGEKPYHCNDCGKSFTELGNLKKHQRIHTGEKPYHCNECEMRFNYLAHLKKHQQTHTGEKPHHCNECGRSFNQTESLKRHQRSHTGEKPHHCIECDKRFSRLEHLKNHQRIHRREITPL